MAPVKRFSLAMLLMLASAQLVLAQATGKLLITVTDSQGKPLANVTITIHDTQLVNFKKILHTNKKGSATHGALVNHLFHLTVELAGYQTQMLTIQIPAYELHQETVVLRTNEEVIAEAEANDPHAQAVNRFNRAVEYLNQGDADQAIPLLEESLKLDNTIHQTWLEMGKIYFIREKYAEARQHLLKAVELNPGLAVAYRLLAAIEEKSGNAKEAERYSKLAQEKGGVTAIDKFNDGITAFNKNDMDTAIALFKESLQLDPNWADSYFQLGMSQLNKGLNAEAIVNLNKYLELQPNGSQAETCRQIIKALQPK